MTWLEGQKAMEFLIGKVRLERIDPGDAEATANALLEPFGLLVAPR